MTWFVIACAVMVVTAVGLIARPLLRAPLENTEVANTKERRWVVIVFACGLPVLAAALYVTLTTWDWSNQDVLDAKGHVAPDAIAVKLEAKLRSNPADIESWLKLGRAYSAAGRTGRSLDAYQQAYDRSQGENVEAITGVGEALALLDDVTLTSRAGQLFEQALAKEPDNAKALWYGGIAALRSGQTAVARDRLQALLGKNPPEQLRALLERQVQDLNEQLGTARTAPATNAPAAKSAAARSLDVSVSIAPAIAAKLQGNVALFVLARDPGAGGPPLAVVRRTSSELPLNVALTERDAMLPNRSIATVTQVQVVARLSFSGAPREQSGDFYGTADYAFDREGPVGKVKILIDRAVP